MFSKNLKYYRLIKKFSKKELADIIHVSPMSISHYEDGKRKPDMDILNRLAHALEVRISDFLVVRDDNIKFIHGDFRKNTVLNQSKQELIKCSVEEYFNRFMSVIEILGGDVIPNPPKVGTLLITEDVEVDAQSMRSHLRLSNEGPLGNLVQILENKGFFIYYTDVLDDDFSGMNGFVNDHPYIVLNSNMSPERIRSTIAHELAHLLFDWSSCSKDVDIEKHVTAISGAFLFPKLDAIRELGPKRRHISRDVTFVAKEYGISMFLLVKRANQIGIFNDALTTDFYIKSSKMGWRKNEPSRIQFEQSNLFEQLTYRAINEQEISLQKGAELLKIPYDVLEHRCSLDDNA